MYNNATVLRLALLALFLLTHPLASLHGAITEVPFDDMESLISRSDLIVRGHVQRIKQNVRDTAIVIIVDETFKGSLEQKSIIVRHGGGKFLVKNGEPSFMTYDESILYLVRSADHSYRCLDGAEGKKTIVNENIYLHPENNFAVMKTKKYTEELARRAKDKHPDNPA